MLKSALVPPVAAHSTVGIMAVLSLSGSLPISPLDSETLEGRDWLSSLHHPVSEPGVEYASNKCLMNECLPLEHTQNTISKYKYLLFSLTLIPNL